MVIRMLYLDMYDVLVDFERGVLELAGMEPTPLNGKKDAGYDDRMWKAIQKVDHFYGKLLPMPGALEMLNMPWKRYSDRCEILTDIPNPHRNILYAREDKWDCVKQLLSSEEVVNAVL